MDAQIIPKTISCMQYTFNGSLIAKVGNEFTNVFSSERNDVVLFNVYRNGYTKGSPCNLSCKRLNLKDMSLVFDIARHITTNESKEDPRLFVFNKKLMMSYNQLIYKDKVISPDKIESVRVHVAEISSVLRLKKPIKLPQMKNIEIQPWEKNWLFFEHESMPGLWIVYQLYPELIILNPKGEIVIKDKWQHPLEIGKFSTQMVKTFRHINAYSRRSNLYHTFRKNVSIRGGAHPVLLNGFYYCFAHTRENEGGLYRMIVLVLNASDMKLNYFTMPMTIPGYENVHIIYPIGAVFDKYSDIWYISCGLMDSNQLIIKMPHVYLNSKLIHL